MSRDVDEGSATPSSCNYVLSTSNGNLLASPQSCPSGATWVIRVANNKRIRLEFITFNLYLPQEYVRIRDGVNARAKVLAFHTGQLIPDTVTSTGNQIYVEYEVFAKGKPPDRGFSASYTSLGKSSWLLLIFSLRLIFILLFYPEFDVPFFVYPHSLSIYTLW